MVLQFSLDGGEFITERCRCDHSTMIRGVDLQLSFVFRDVFDIVDCVVSYYRGHSKCEQADALQPIGAAEFDSGFDALTAPIGE